MVSRFLSICLGFSWWIDTVPSVLLLGEYPRPKKNDYE